MFDLLTEEPRDTPWNTRGCGLAVPALMIIPAVRIMTHQTATIGAARYRHVELHGKDASLFGLAVLAVAFWMHCHFYWNHHRKLMDYADMGKATALFLFIICLGTILVRQFKLL